MTLFSSQILGASAPSGLLIAGMAIIGVFLLMRATRRRAQSAAKPVNATPVRQRYAHLSDQTRSVRSAESAIAQLDEVSRQIHGRLDTKLARLEAVIRDADARIAELKRLENPKEETTSGLDVTLDGEEPVEFSMGKVPDNHSQVDSAHDRICALADRGVSPEQIARDLNQPVGEIELVLSLRSAAID